MIPHRIFAIDPGTAESGVVLLENGKPRLPRVMPNDELLAYVRSGLPADLLAIEGIACYGMPVGAETFETCFFIGRILEAAMPLECRMVYRREVKLTLCGSMQAKDPNIRQALIDLYGGKDAVIGKKAAPGPLREVKSHAWSALAVAVTALSQVAGSGTLTRGILLGTERR